MAKSHGTLCIGIGGHVVALDAHSGEERWRTRLKRSSETATLFVDGTRIYAGAGGELFALDAATGSILWQNKLKGLGTGIIAFPSAGDAVVAAVLEARAAAASGAAIA